MYIYIYIHIHTFISGSEKEILIKKVLNKCLDKKPGN